MIKAMTFNLRVESEADGINRFSLRTHRVLGAIATESPDLIGFQEATDPMRAFMRNALKDEYTFIGGGSYVGHKGPGNPIAFKRDVFELVSLETRWFSPTPEVPGSRHENSDQSKYPRYYLKTVLRVMETNELICFINTHTDHVGANVRTLQAKQMRNVLRESADMPVILLGDMNAKPDEESIQLLSFDECTDIVDVTSAIPSSFHWWGQLNPPIKVDYIFSNMPCVDSHAIEDHPTDGVFISDHNPVVATLLLPSDATNNE